MKGGGNCCGQGVAPRRHGPVRIQNADADDIVVLGYLDAGARAGLRWMSDE